MKKVNENVALAKAILNKNGITSDSVEYQDYLKIREICGNSHGYVGILTRIRFEDGITDWEEIESIFSILKNSKIDIGKIHKMSYEDILNIFYDQFKTTSKNDDYEIIFKDSEYTYYRVYTYKGIMKIGSPAWCLKTKSNWDKYQEIYPEQYVIVNNKYKNRLPVPEDDILANYSSIKGYVRYGISVRVNSDRTISWTGNDDNNREVNFNPESYTFYGVFCTLLNILRGSKKSYYDEFIGCEKVERTKTWHKMVRFEDAFDRLQMDKNYVEQNDDTEIYMTLSESYSHHPVLLILDKTCPRCIYPTKTKKELKCVDLIGGVSKSLIENYARKSSSNIYLGIKLKLGEIKIDDVEKVQEFIEEIDNWLIFDHNKKYYLCVNSNPNKYSIPARTLIQENFDIHKDPLYYYIEKDKLKPVAWISDLPIRDHHKKVIEFLKSWGKEPDKDKDKDKKGIKRFWNFRK